MRNQLRMAAAFSVAALVVMLVSPAGARGPSPVSFGRSGGAVEGRTQSAIALSGTLYDQTDNLDTVALISDDFEAVNDAYDNEMADDFVVPAGETWSIDAVTVRGWNLGGPNPSFDVRFYPDAGTVPGSPALSTYAGVAPTVSGFFWTFALAVPTVLSAGSYWVSVVADATFTTTSTWWFWQWRTVVSNDPSVWRNPGDGFGAGCTSWSSSGVCNQADPPEGRDAGFSLTGTAGLPGPSLTCDGGLTGGAGADTITGTSAPDHLCGRGGNDTLDGAGANDIVDGGAGDDAMDGGAGDDLLKGRKGADVITDHDGTDTLKGAYNRDTLDAQDGSGGDVVNGGRGDDTCFADPGDTVVNC